MLDLYGKVDGLLENTPIRMQLSGYGLEDANDNPWDPNDPNDPHDAISVPNRPVWDFQTEGDDSSRYISGLAYRRDLPYLLKLVSDDEVLAYSTFSMPNLSNIYHVEYEASSFVKTDMKTTFENGMLTNTALDRPSEGLAIAALPITVLRAFTTIITDIIQIKIDQTGKESDLAAKEVELLKALADLEAAKRGEFPEDNDEDTEDGS